MRSFVLRHGVLIGIALIFIGSALTFLWGVWQRDPLAGRHLTTTDIGTVEQLVAVSGVTESRHTADLAFPVTGIVATTTVTEGERVVAGTLLATLANAAQVATLARAEAEVAIAEAALLTTRTGSRLEARAISTTAVENATANLARARANATLAIDSATSALYSTDLTARAVDTDEDAPAPTITGTYRCATPGTYTLRVYNSSAASGYSLQLAGLETGTYPVSTEQPATLGTCGLFATFTPNATYHNSEWTITIPNQSSDQYVTLSNALATAKQTATNSIAAATEALALATTEANLANAAPLAADVRAAEARVAQAKATLAALTAELADRSIIAPFTGVVSRLDIRPGETAPTTPVITLVATDAFEVVARVPEVDITKIATGLPARLSFDAAADTIATGTVFYIAPLPTLVDGVAYFEVKIQLATTPSWLRGGLNADIDIITAVATSVVRLPSRYLSHNGDMTTVTTLVGGTIATSTVTVSFLGNDGYAAVTGLPAGTTVIAP